MTYYEILQVTENASEEVVRMAYKALAKKYHPDVFEGNPQEAEEKMKIINEAFEVLSNSEKRKLYDEFLASKKKSFSQQTTEEVSSQKDSQVKEKKISKLKKLKNIGFAFGIFAILIVIFAGIWWGASRTFNKPKYKEGSDGKTYTYYEEFGIYLWENPYATNVYCDEKGNEYYKVYNYSKDTWSLEKYEEERKPSFGEWSMMQQKEDKQTS